MIAGDDRSVRLQPLLLNGVVILPSWAAIPMLFAAILFGSLGVAVLWSHHEMVDEIRRLEREVRILEARSSDIERAVIAAGVVRASDLATAPEDDRKGTP